MGQVFTWDAIRKGRIPELSAFDRVAGMIRRRLEAESSVASALLFGSVVRKDFNIRSDIDCVVIYRTTDERRALAVMRSVALFAHRQYVPINFTPCDTVLAQTRLHHIGGSFIRHLQASIDAGGLVKGNLVDLLAPTLPHATELESYFKAKIYNLEEAYALMSTFSEERRVATFKKALEAATHVARKMLIYEGKLTGDSKKDVRNRYREVMPEALSQQFDHLLIIDAGYSETLAEQLQEPDRRVYQQKLADLESATPMVIPFIRDNILRIVHGAR